MLTIEIKDGQKINFLSASNIKDIIGESNDEINKIAVLESFCKWKNKEIVFEGSITYPSKSILNIIKFFLKWPPCHLLH